MFVVKTLKLSNGTASSGNSYYSAWAYRFHFGWKVTWLVTEHHWKELGSIFFTLSLHLFICIYQMRSEPSPLWAKWSQLSQPFLRRDGQDSSSSLWPFNGLSLVVPLSPESHTALQGQPHWAKGKYSCQRPSLGLKSKDWFPNTTPNNPDCMHLVLFLSIRQAIFSGVSMHDPFHIWNITIKWILHLFSSSS